jgi:hypothetical protein
MSKRFIATMVCSALGLIAASGFAFAESIGRFECNIIDTPGQEPIGDRPGHFLLNLQYSCFAVDGVLKGDVHTASSVSEFDGAKVTFLRGGGIHRAPGGLAVTQIMDGPWSRKTTNPSAPRPREKGSSSLLRVAWPSSQERLSVLPASRLDLAGLKWSTPTDIEPRGRGRR